MLSKNTIIIIILIVASLTFLYYYSSNKEEKFTQQQDEIVLYYASWCGFSRMILPEWEKFEKWAKANLPKLKVSSIRCESGNEETCFQKGIKGYPTIILYPKNGPEITFNKERTADNITLFVKEELTQIF